MAGMSLFSITTLSELEAVFEPYAQRPNNSALEAREF